MTSEKRQIHCPGIDVARSGRYIALGSRLREAADTLPWDRGCWNMTPSSLLLSVLSMIPLFFNNICALHKLKCDPAFTKYAQLSIMSTGNFSLETMTCNAFRRNRYCTAPYSKWKISPCVAVPTPGSGMRNNKAYCRLHHAKVVMDRWTGQTAGKLALKFVLNNGNKFVSKAFHVSPRLRCIEIN